VTDFEQIPDYGRYVATDVYRSGLLYPAVIRELAELCGKRILDIGTGNSPFPSQMAKQGAFVVGYDKSSKQIELARQHAHGLNIKYVVSTRTFFRSVNQHSSRKESLYQLPSIPDLLNSRQTFSFDA